MIRTPLLTPQRKTSMMLVLLSVFVLNLTWGAAHVAFEHDSSHRHHHEEGPGHSHEQPGHSSHSAQDHAPEMLLPRARVLLEEEGKQPLFTAAAQALEIALSQIPADARGALVELVASWRRPTGSQRGPPQFS
jgi:hypothetical protein